MDKGSKNALTIERMPSGGFLVLDAYTDRGMLPVPHFAASTVDEALYFIRDAITPIPPQQEPAKTYEEKAYSIDLTTRPESPQ